MHIISNQLKLLKMRAKSGNLNHCAVPLLSRDIVNLWRYYYIYYIFEQIPKCLSFCFCRKKFNSTYAFLAVTEMLVSILSICPEDELVDESDEGNCFIGISCSSCDRSCDRSHEESPCICVLQVFSLHCILARLAL